MNLNKNVIKLLFYTNRSETMMTLLTFSILWAKLSEIADSLASYFFLM